MIADFRIHMKQITPFFLSFVFCLAGFAQEIISPLDIPLYLSGNFGELRSNHFHSGIDFKTKGVTGLPIKSVQDGYVSRINVSPYGYGNAIYINHPDGTTTVYAHLENFAPHFESLIRENQYLQETFALTLYFEPDELPVKQGEKIGTGGNSGGSGGPHLHFEIRETEGDIPMDPLPYFKDKIKDTRPPEIRGLKIFPQHNQGIVNGETKNLPITLIKDKSGKQQINRKIAAWGEIGIGIKAYDRMSETTNIYGVHEIILNVDGEEVYHSVMGKFSFGDTRYLNSYIDWDSWDIGGEFYMKSFVDPGNRLKFNQSSSNGIILIDQEKDYLFEYILKDVYGNTTTLKFVITGKISKIPILPEPEDWELIYNLGNTYFDKGIELEIPRGNLYTNYSIAVDTISAHTPFSPLYKIGERIPLHSYCPLTLNITSDTYRDKTKYGVVYNRNTSRSWLGGEYESGKMNVKIRELGDFSIEIDTIPPVIRPHNETNWTAGKRISFKITDNLSGIASYKGTLNGRFVLFEYDAKTNSLYCKYDPKRMQRGEQTLILTVDDSAGNRSELVRQIVW